MEQSTIAPLVPPPMPPTAPLHQLSAPPTPNFLPGAPSLSEMIDKPLLVMLRDGRKLIGILRSYDQFANLVFTDTLERTIVGDKYADLERGTFLIRGENVVLIGETQENAFDPIPSFTKVTTKEINQLNKEQQALTKRQEKARQNTLTGMGFSIENVDF